MAFRSRPVFMVVSELHIVVLMEQTYVLSHHLNFIMSLWRNFLVSGMSLLGIIVPDKRKKPRSLTGLFLYS